MDTNPTSQLVVFSLGGAAYALPIGDVHEIIRYSEPRSVASEDPYVCGVISLRGKIVAVYDLAGRLAVTRAEADGDGQKIVIVAQDDALAGIVVDEVEEVMALSEEQFEPLPTVGDALIERVAKVDERLVIVLRASEIVGADADELETPLAA